MDIQIHKSCATLPIYNFYKVIEQDDLRYLIVGYNELDENRNLSIKQRKEFGLIFEDIVVEYYVLTNNRKILSNKLKIFEVEALEYKLMVLDKIINLYDTTKVYQALELLNDVGYKFDKSKDHEVQANVIRKKIKALKNQIRINKSNFVELNKTRNKEIKIDLEKQASRLEVNLGLGYQLNTRVISVEKWVSLLDINYEKSLNYGSK